MAINRARNFLQRRLGRGPKVTNNAARTSRKYAADVAAMKGDNLGRNLLIGGGLVGLRFFNDDIEDKFNLDEFGNFFQAAPSAPELPEPEENTVPFDTSSNTPLDPEAVGYSDQTRDPREESPFFEKDSGSSDEENNGGSTKPKNELIRDTSSGEATSEALLKFLDPKLLADRDREFFKRQLIQNELSQRAGLAKYRERSRREIEKQRIDAWARVNQQSILRDQAMFQSAAASIAATNPSNALAKLQSMALTDIGDIVPTRVIKSS